MQTRRLGCITSTGIMAAVITVLVIAGYAYASGGMMYNPGPLNAEAGEMLGGVTSHAQITECNACHTAPWEPATMADRCADCHGDIAAQMRDVASLHGGMLHNNPGLSCRHCHPEHRGAEAPLTIMEGGSFPHEAMGFSLNGHPLTARREPFICADCHQDDVSTFDLGTCQACHLEMDNVFILAHAIEYGTACLDCHDGVDRFGKNFDHAAGFALAGGHEGLICSKCHTNARTFTDFSRAPSDCFSCHQRDDAHNGRFGTDCAACHQPATWEDATFDHNQSNFPLTGRHAALDCEQCHANGQFTGLPATCVNCHADPIFHAGMFGSDCASCHSTENWFALYAGPHPGIADEGGSGVNHGNTSCRTCHTQTLSAATCTACHDSNNPDDEGGDDD